MGPGLRFDRPQNSKVAFERIEDLSEIHDDWLRYERRAVRRVKHPDDRHALRTAINKTEDAIRAVSTFVARPGEEEATGAGIAVARASNAWNMLRGRVRSHQTARRASVWIDSLAIWSRTLTDASPYASAFDPNEVCWEDLTG